MIVLDTNVISELMKESPSRNVLTWIDQQIIEQLFITTITIAEISYGINALPISNRRRSLDEAFNQAINHAFKHRLLSFDESAAHHYGTIMNERKKLGKPLSILDGQIAAIALAQNATLATRNIRDFIDCQLTLINPF